MQRDMPSLAAQVESDEGVGVNTSYGAVPNMYIVADEENVGPDGTSSRAETASESRATNVVSLPTKLGMSFTLAVAVVMAIALVQRFPGNDVPKTATTATTTATTTRTRAKRAAPRTSGEKPSRVAAVWSSRPTRAALAVVVLL